MKVTMEQFINPITEFFKTANKSVVYIEFSLFGTLFIVAAIFLYLFFNKKKKIETEEDCQKEKNEEKKLENKKNQKSDWYRFDKHWYKASHNLDFSFNAQKKSIEEIIDEDEKIFIKYYKLIKL